MARRRWIVLAAAAAGFVAPAKRPRRGLVVILQGREAGRWRTFADTRTNRSRRWRVSFRFRGNAGTYPIRARVRRQAGCPYELGYSWPVVVRVR